MIDLDILEKHGLTEDNLKMWFKKDLAHVSTEGMSPNSGIVEGKPGSDEAKRAALVKRITLRIQEGRNKNLTDYTVWKAINLAWDQPFKQITPTLVQELMDADPDDDKVAKKIESFGLSQLIDTVPDPKSQGKKIKRFNAPAFFEVMVPLARSVTIIRLAKIVNDRNVNPFFNFGTPVATEINRLRSEILNSRVEVMNQQYGYFRDFQQSALYMLKYGTAFELPAEEWHQEEQLMEYDGKEEAKTVKEGLRFYHPHPSRCFWDRAHGPGTFNTDTGCEYFGTWKISRYGTIRNNSKWWNTDSVTVGSAVSYWWSGAEDFFQAVYGGCTMSWPNWQAGNNENDRETLLGFGVYQQDWDDKAVQVTEYFEKIVPADHGMGTYAHPVWFRFVLAGDDTVLYCAPVPYCPVTYAGYDADEYQDKNSSLTLEAIPFQDQFSNVLSQHLLSIRQNLANLTLVDEEAIKPGWLEQIQNNWEKMYRKINIFPFSSKMWKRRQLERGDVMQSWRFPQLNTNDFNPGSQADPRHHGARAGYVGPGGGPTSLP